jgi:thymidylate synthase (FAD)
MPRSTTPEVFLVARPSIDWAELYRYVESVGGEEWTQRIDDDCENGDFEDGQILIEAMGRLCYRSWAPGLNANVTKVREDSGAYLRNLIDSGHGAVLEHAQYSFIFKDVSRVFTHELVRHRVGVAISQESLRYVRLTEIPFRVPTELTEGLPEHQADIVRTIGQQLLEHMEGFQSLLSEWHGLDDESNFSRKKEVTSAMRRFAPMGLSTTIGWSANVRTLHALVGKPNEEFGLRTSPHAEEEIRSVFGRVREIMQREAPLLFGTEEGQ